MKNLLYTIALKLDGLGDSDFERAVVSKAEVDEQTGEVSLIVKNNSTKPLKLGWIVDRLEYDFDITSIAGLGVGVFSVFMYAKDWKSKEEDSEDKEGGEDN